MLVKSRTSRIYRDDLEETFATLRKYQMKLNPITCAFGVTLNKCLGFMVSNQGVEANPEKIRAIQEMTPPKNIKKVQRLTVRVAMLNRFVSRSIECCLPFFQTLRQPKNFQWTEEYQWAFEELKNYLSSSLLPNKPKPDEELHLHLTISSVAISAVLVHE